MSSQHALPVICPGCGETILEADYDRTQGVHITLMRADPTHITPATETACIILTRTTYNYWQTGNNMHLAPRNPSWHKWHHVGPPTHVLPAHKCGRHLPGTPITLPNLDSFVDVNPDLPCPY